MKKMTRKILVLSVMLSLLSAFIGLPAIKVANAAAITTASDTLSTVAPSVAANHEIKFGSPTGIAAGNTVIYTFSAGFVMGSVALGDIDFATGSTSTCSSATYTEQALAATASGATWGATVVGQVITITSGTGTSTAGNCLRLRVGTNTVTGGVGVNQITNPVASDPTVTMSGTFGDTGTITVHIVANTVSVSATVGQTITFSLGATSVPLGTLSVSAPSTGSHTISLSTNGGTGMVVTYSGTTLTSGANTITALSAGGTSAAGTSQFGINAVANTTPTVGAACSGTAPIAAAATGYATANNFKFVTGDTIISSTGAINTSSCTISYLANIAGTTAAGSYTSTLTFIATATF